VISENISSEAIQKNVTPTTSLKSSLNSIIQTNPLSSKSTPLPVLTEKSISVKEGEIEDLEDKSRKGRKSLDTESNGKNTKSDLSDGLLPDDPDFYSKVSVIIEGDALPPARERFDSAIGKKAPVVKGISLEGKDIYIGEEGYYHLIIILAHWCPHCRNEVRELTNYLKETEIPSNLQIISLATAIHSDRANYPPHEWFRNEKWPLPVIVDTHQSDIANHFGVTSYPYFILIDDDGKIQSRRPGRLGINGIESLFGYLEKVRLVD
jgi:thiol-disulfide isomerase/thioredoxin